MSGNCGHWTTSDQISLKESAKGVGKGISDAIDGVSKVAQTIDKGARSLSDITSGVSRTLQNAVTKLTSPANSITNFATQALKLTEIPSKCLNAPLQIINAYKNMAKDLKRKFKNDPFSIEKTKNQWAMLKLALTGGVAAGCSAAAYSVSQIGAEEAESGDGIKSREDAVRIAEELQDFYEETAALFDEQTGRNLYVDTGTSMAALLDLVRKTQSLVLDAGFGLKTRRVIVLDRERQMIELCAELYGAVDGKLDGFIADNKLTADEMEIIPMGREIAYYV